MNTHELLSPIKEVRQRHGISQIELASLADMSAQAVMRYEQSVYDKISLKLAQALADLEQCPVGEIEVRYDLHRHEVQVYANLTITPPLRIALGEHPFETFRKDVMRAKGLKESRMAFCILLAIHPAVVSEYDSGRTRQMPALIDRALNNAGMPYALIETLNTFGELWYERHQ